MKIPLLTLALLVGNSYLLCAQKTGTVIEVLSTPEQKKVIITADGKPFTEFIYPDSLEKHTLYPIYASDGQLITRGFPLNPRPGEPTDHPHHLGLWLNYEKVNGLDFWNNSYNIKADKKHLYGWIKVDSILYTKNGEKGELKISSIWHDQQKNILLHEITHFIFAADRHTRTIDRVTTLTAQKVVSFTDVKDGLLGLRVTAELQKREVPKEDNDQAIVSNGIYITSEGKAGDSAWGTRAKWCLLYGTKNNSVLSIAIIDHPGNPGYPTYWHARGYGLFAANPLGQKIFSNGKERMDLYLQKNQSVTFRYRVLISAGSEKLSNAKINISAKSFAREPSGKRRS